MWVLREAANISLVIQWKSSEKMTAILDYMEYGYAYISWLIIQFKHFTLLTDSYVVNAEFLW